MTYSQSSMILRSLPALLLMSFSLLSFGQAKAPYEMTINGVKVIVQPSGNEIVQIMTVIRGGVQNYSLEQQGIEQLAIDALTECGTAKDDKNSFKDKLDKVSAEMYGSAGMDYSSFVMNCIRSDFDEVWPLYIDALTTPRFDKKEFERIRQDAINNLRSRASQPDYAIQKLAKETAFAGKNYAKTTEGNETTVSKLTPEITKAYYKSVLTRSRLLIVVVAEIDSAVLAQNIQALLSGIPAGAAFTEKREVYSPKHNSFKDEKRDLATNYIQGVTSAPLPGTPDFNAFSLAMRIFYNRHFLTVRTNHGLSYAPYTYFDGGLYPSGNIDVSTKDPNRYKQVLDSLISNIKKDGFTEEELRNMKTSYVTGFYYRQETNAAQASSLASNEILHKNWRRSYTMNDDMKKVTVSDLNRVFNKYITSITWVYQGDPQKVNTALYTQEQKPPVSKLSNSTKD
ncbi:MAG TPA: pitrilysin family protein [Puia sp.]|nr:pitrilysin family protein [Puia sp.]